MESEEVKRIREKLGLTQSELAEVFGGSGANAVGNVETGFRKLGSTKNLMLRLLDYLSIPEAKELVGKLQEQSRLYGNES